MRRPIGKTLLIACFIFASMAFATTNLAKNKEITLSATLPATTAPAPMPAPAPAPAADVELEAETLYDEMELEKTGLKEEVLETALKGFHKLDDEGKIEDTRKLTIVDFSQPSTQKRMYVIDLEQKKLLFQSLVSHGRNTGTLWARSFSNRASSYKSSPGFYITAETYMGGNGYSLRLDGVEKNINDNARNRAIVMHGAPYASSVNGLGYLGRSQGCPALPVALHRPVINTIKNGTCLFVYTPDKSYLDRSEILN